MFLPTCFILIPGLLAAVQPGSSHLVPWPSWLGTWLADSAVDAPVLPQDRQCVADSRLVLDHFANHTAWAARMLDASSIGPSPGLLKGVTDSLGDFDECLGLHWPHAPAAPVEPQYCLVTMSTSPLRPPTGAGRAAWSTVDDVGPYENVHSMMQSRGQHRGVAPLGKMRFGVCVPASCSPEAVSRAAQRQLAPESSQGIHWAVEVEHPWFCTQRKHVAAGSSTRLIIVGLLVLFGLLVLIGSALDPHGAVDLKKGGVLHMLSAFSLRRQWFGLTQPKDYPNKIDALDGYKTFACIIVVIFHHLVTIEAFTLGSNSFVTPADGSPPLLLIWLQDSVNSGMAYFFFLSGYLMIRSGREASPSAPLQRAKRFLPYIVVMTWVQAVVLPDLGSGPVWRWRMEGERSDCKAAWWRNLLFVNNVGPRGPPTCLIQLWSLAVDMQCFVVCQIAMWTWVKWQQLSKNSTQKQDSNVLTSSSEDRADATHPKGWCERSGLFLAISLALAVRVGMSLYNKWLFVLPMDHASVSQFENAAELFRSYTPASIHLLSYVLGAVTAVLVKPLYRDSTTPKISKTAGNVACAATIILTVGRAVLTYQAWRDALDLGPGLDVVASTVRQVASCVLIAVKIILLEPRIARPNAWQWLLGNRLTLVLRRLSGLVYLLHMTTIMTSNFSTRGPVSQGTLSLITEAMTSVVQAFLWALFVQLAVLGPIFTLHHSWPGDNSNTANCNDTPENYEKNK